MRFNRIYQVRPWRMRPATLQRATVKGVRGEEGSALPVNVIKFHTYKWTCELTGGIKKPLVLYQ